MRRCLNLRSDAQHWLKCSILTSCQISIDELLCCRTSFTQSECVFECKYLYHDYLFGLVDALTLCVSSTTERLNAVLKKQKGTKTSVVSTQEPVAMFDQGVSGYWE